MGCLLRENQYPARFKKLCQSCIPEIDPVSLTDDTFLCRTFLSRKIGEISLKNKKKASRVDR